MFIRIVILILNTTIFIVMILIVFIVPIIIIIIANFHLSCFKGVEGLGVHKVSGFGSISYKV